MKRSAVVVDWRIVCLSTRAFFLFACLSCGSIGVSGITTSYHRLSPLKPTGTIAVVSSDKELANSLEFDFFREKLERKLEAVGFFVVDDPAKARFLAFLAYGIDSGTEKIVSKAIVGQTGGGASYASGTIYGSGGTVFYSGTTYQMPRYGVVGTRLSSVTQYKRVVAIHILEAKDLEEEYPKPLMQSETMSTGVCPTVNSVFDEMLEGAFSEFPGRNGDVRSWRVESMSSNC